MGTNRRGAHLCARPKSHLDLRCKQFSMRGKGFFWSLGQFSITVGGENHLVEDCQNIPKTVAELPRQFLDIFITPTGLPPIRERDYAIVLKEGTSPTQ